MTKKKPSSSFPSRQAPKRAGTSGQAPAQDSPDVGLAPLIPPPLPPAEERDRMPLAWAILGVSLGLLVWVEAARVKLPVSRPTNFLAGLQPRASQPVPTPWPTPHPLPPLGKRVVKTSPAQVSRVLAPSQRPKTMRIAYFADSMIEGDLITEGLRRHLQDRFGGSGVGWVGMAPLDAWARDDIQQTFDPAWQRHSLLKSGWEGQPYGPQGTSWTLDHGKGAVHFKGLKPVPAYKFLAPATLWYGPVSPGAKARVTMKVDGQPLVLVLEGTQPVNAMILTERPCQALDLDFNIPPNLYLFGVSFDDGSGVDSFSTRGSHGGPLSRLDLDFLRSLRAQRRYDLVITQFGINAMVLTSDPSFRWYRRSLVGGLQRLQQGFGPAALVLVSATDRSVPQGAGWVSDPMLPGLLESQRAAAADLGIPFINAFDLMGGPGTMAQWGAAKPRLCERDYTHMTPQGAKRFEEALWLVLQGAGGPSGAMR